MEEVSKNLGRFLFRKYDGKFIHYYCYNIARTFTGAKLMSSGHQLCADRNGVETGAIVQYNHCTKKLNELDEEEIETVENVTVP